MNNERYNQVIGNAYKNYLIEDAKILPNMSKEKMTELGFRLTQQEFIDKIKTDDEFSKKCGLKIEERELSVQERQGILEKIFPMYYIDQQFGGEDIFTRNNIPTRAISFTYNNETIEVYE